MGDFRSGARQGRRVAAEAYVRAGFKRNDGNASRLNGNEKVAARVKEILNEGADRCGVTCWRPWRQFAGQLRPSRIRSIDCCSARTKARTRNARRLHLAWFQKRFQRPTHAKPLSSRQRASKCAHLRSFALKRLVSSEVSGGNAKEAVETTVLCAHASKCLHLSSFVFMRGRTSEVFSFLGQKIEQI